MPKLCKEHGVPHQLNAHFGNCGGKFILAAAELPSNSEFGVLLSC
jgi:hypothetical protein